MYFVQQGNPDILICGNCRELFDDLVDMLEHKKNYCKMRFTCKCEEKDDTACSDKDCGRIKELPSSQSTGKLDEKCILEMNPDNFSM